MVFNSLFDKNLMDYCENYDNEQSNSECFLGYIDSLIEMYEKNERLKHKTILEIGCGKGAFLKRICERTNSKGFGFDSTYDGNIKSDNVIYESGYFGKQDKKFKADFIFLRHVLEHIDNPFRFLFEIIDNIDNSHKSKIIIEVPDFDWIVKNKAFWDIYYEHCNYFTKYSLQNLANSLGLKVDNIFNTFNGQYMVLIATTDSSKTPVVQEKPSIPEDLLNRFSNNILFIKRQNITDTINQTSSGEYFIVWGGAPKGIIFLITLDSKTREKIKFVVDINKEKQGRYTAITGKIIKSPDALKKETSVKNVIIMNPNYEGEILEILKKMNRKFNVYKI